MHCLFAVDTVNWFCCKSCCNCAVTVRMIAQYVSLVLVLFMASSVSALSPIGIVRIVIVGVHPIFTSKPDDLF